MILIQGSCAPHDLWNSLAALDRLSGFYRKRPLDSRVLPRLDHLLDLSNFDRLLSLRGKELKEVPFTTTSRPCITAFEILVKTNIVMNARQSIESLNNEPPPVQEASPLSITQTWLQRVTRRPRRPRLWLCLFCLWQLYLCLWRLCLFCLFWLCPRPHPRTF